MRGVSDVERLLTQVADLNGALAVDYFGRQQSETRMMVLGVVPGEEVLAKVPGMQLGAEAFWKLRSILQGLELALREWIVVGDVRTAMGLSHSQIGEQKGHGLGGH